MNKKQTTTEKAHPIPRLKKDRIRFRKIVDQYVSRNHLVPPLCLEELQEHTRTVIHSSEIPEEFSDFITIQISNRIWEDTVAGVPFERRILLLPQCLRSTEHCQAELDEFGLLCEQCGNCHIGTLQEEAEALGYVVLVAEGTTVVTKLIEQGKIDAVIGVSCLGVLEKAFPHMAAHAIPGIAIPLNSDGCVNTTVDLDRVRNAIHTRSEAAIVSTLDLDLLRTEVNYWFSEDKLSNLLKSSNDETEKIAISWLAKSGKRWRPLLAVSTYRSLTGDQDIPEAMKKLAIAVECFHKASLIHDDIEDDDQYRYGAQTLHREYGTPMALNVGDLLLGEGYRLIAECGLPALQRAELLKVASTGHRNLCLGQGKELSWMRTPTPLSSEQVIEIFRKKTAPAFEVALHFGAISAGADSVVLAPLKQFSESLGIAYQIRDDLQDALKVEDGDCHSEIMRPSIILATAYESSTKTDQKLLVSAWQQDYPKSVDISGEITRIISKLRITEKVQLQLEHYKNQAIRSLKPLQNSDLKSLMHRIVGRIFREK